jgi:hypothetical protein
MDLNAKIAFNPFATKGINIFIKVKYLPEQ